jgi:dihydrofolate synthase/folylpolyglutamate synthase
MGADAIAEEAEAYLHLLKRNGPKLGLGRMKRLLHALGEPQHSFKSVLVGGTNGKGSTAAMMDSVLRAAGYRTGRYTSPHLSFLNERITMDGKPITDHAFAEIIAGIRSAVERMRAQDASSELPTFFETVTAAAFMHFKASGADFAVVEVGLGGRLDATNTLAPLVSVITNISLEHTEILGDTIAKIAREKAGIIKRDGILVTGSQDGEALGVFQKVCRENGSRMLEVGRDIKVERKDERSDGGATPQRMQRFSLTLPDGERHELETPLLGRHQLLNAACAAGAVHALRKLGIAISDDALREGMRRAEWPGRMEVVQDRPLVVLDCAKDAEAAASLRRAFDEDAAGAGGRRLVLVIGISSDKDIGRMLGELVPMADTVVATAHKVMGRSAAPERMARMAAAYGKRTLAIPDVREAVGKAITIAGPGGAVLVTGSVFTVGEARERWFPRPRGQGRFGRDFNETPRK